MTHRAIAQKTFNILDHIDKLEPAQKKGKYICPVCGDNNLSISSKNGAYKCWSGGCSSREIRDAIAPINLSDPLPYPPRRQPKLKPKPKSKPQLKPKPQPLPATVELARLPENREDGPKPLKGSRQYQGLGQVQTRTFQYLYPDGCFVERIEFWKNPDERIEKVCYPKHTTDDGAIAKGLGKKDWQPYRIDEIESLNLEGQFPLFLEGEKTVEASRYLALAAVTLQGSQWTQTHLRATFDQLKKAGAGGVVFIPDCDQAGLEKAQKAALAAAEAQIPILFLDLALLASPHEIREAKGYDLADFVKNRMSDQSIEAIRQSLEEALQLVLEDGGGGDDFYDGHEDWGDDNDDDDWADDPNLIDGETYERNCLRTIFASNYVVLNDAFYQYQSALGYWLKIEDAEIKRIISTKAQVAYKIDKDGYADYKFFNAAKIKSSFESIRASLTRSDPPSNQHLIAFLNGTLDVRTGQIQPHNPDNLLTWGITDEYRPGAKIPSVFEKFIIQSIGTELLPLIRAILSMYLDPTAPYGYATHFYGPSGGGKGTMLRLIASLFPNHATMGLSNFQDINTDEGRHQRLTGKRFAYFPDVGGFQSGLRSFYELVDNGSLGGRKLHSSDAYSKKWNVRFAFASVDHLQIENSGDGWARRIIQIPVKKRPGNPDPQLGQKLAEHRSDIISWALSMPREERENILHNATNLFPQLQGIKREAEVYGDSVKAFIDACLVPSHSQISVKSSELHAAYKAYCQGTGLKANALNKFVSHARKIDGFGDFYQKRKVGKQNGKTVTLCGAHWRNIGFSTPDLFQLGDSEDMSDYSLGNFGGQKSPNLICNTAKLAEGGLQAFEEFTSPPEVSEVSEEISSSPPAVESDPKPTPNPEVEAEGKVQQARAQLQTVTTAAEYTEIYNHTDRAIFDSAWEALDLAHQHKISDLFFDSSAPETDVAEEEETTLSPRWRELLDNTPLPPYSEAKKTMAQIQPLLDEQDEETQKTEKQKREQCAADIRSVLQHQPEAKRLLSFQYGEITINQVLRTLKPEEIDEWKKI